MNYKISQVAHLLAVSDDTVRRWIDDGRISAVPGTSPREVSGQSVAQYLRERHPADASHHASNRNLLEGIVLEVIRDRVVSQVVLQCGNYRIVSVITTEAVDALGLAPGVIANAQIKATSVSVVK
ncbi:TOBE domain-containing protein [Neoactinobaculum massilliense]|uniref:TOBE domain-containing protein n=1 Tax=Neoactinobaculum massilliense TaxID=2364794 RepID=UPI000F543629|nr:TOBE domain-containing protein [Neoactinobaculum massilliense]